MLQSLRLGFKNDLDWFVYTFIYVSKLTLTLMICKIKTKRGYSLIVSVCGGLQSGKKTAAIKFSGKRKQVFF